MPTINITEKDYSNLNSEYANFSVVIPGIYAAGHADVITAKADENHIYECSSIADFEDVVGCVAPKELTYQSGTSTRKYFHYGNQMAYECIKAGYTVLFIALAEESNESNVGSDNTIITELEKQDNFEALLDRSAYDFRYITNGLLSENATSNSIIARVADYRGDCTALVDLDETKYTGKISQKALIQALTTAENTCGVSATTTDWDATDVIEPKYAAKFAPSFCYSTMPAMKKFNNNTKFPAVMHYLLCTAYAKTYGNYDEWFANAGEVRGICKYNIASTSVKLGEAAMNYLEPRKTIDAQTASNYGLGSAVNVIVTHRGNHYLWGNRTAHPLNTNDLVYSHFLNIRQLCSTLKKQIYVTCKHLTFDPNNDVLWINFCDSIRPILEKMKGNQGIIDYKFVRIATKAKATLKAKVRIIPIEAVEDFDIEVSLEETFGELSATVTE